MEKFWIKLCLRKKCIHCSKEFPEGIVRKLPNQSRPWKAIWIFTPQYLVHCQTTHGYTPDTIDYFLEEIKKIAKLDRVEKK